MFIYLPLHVAAKFYSHHQVVYKSISRKYTKYTYLQYVPGMVYVWKAAVHYISAVCTLYGLRLEGCCTLHICSIYQVWFTFGRLLYITYLQYVPTMVNVWKAAIYYIIYSMTYIGFYLF